jgi:hypothetical protein
VAGKAESIDAYSGNMDWDTPFKNAPSCDGGEFAAPGTNPVVADLNALSSSETARTPSDGFTGRSQAKFPTRDGGKTA